MNTRRRFLHQSLAAAAGALSLPTQARAQQLSPLGENMTFGLCTYMWGAEWDLPTLISNLQSLEIGGVELRVDHAHKVAPTMSPQERAATRQVFVDSGIEVVGMGTNAQFDSPDRAALLTNIDITKQYIKLSHDIGGSGVKVKPNNLHVKDGISKERTLEQIGKTLADLGGFALGFGQEIRLEVHGEVTDLADIRKVMEIASEDNVRVCWNSNPADITDGGLQKSFDLIKDYLGHTTHVRPLQDDRYPFASLIKLLVQADYDGWVLMEAAVPAEDKVKALAEQKDLFTQLVRQARTI